MAAMLALVPAGCKKPSPAPPAPAPAPAPAAPAPKQNLFVLLPDTGARSRMIVTNSAGTVEVSEPNMAVRVERNDSAPGASFAMSDADVQRLFADTAALLPAAPVTFVLYFDKAGDTLTPDSIGLIAEIVRAIRERRSTSVSATGHTDTTDSAAANYELGLRRAKRVGEMLLKEGLSADALLVTSHGESDLLVKTPDGVAEPLNRRVEVVVR
jgi:outer membrane protein OmpA-like peptidoglycan-associated protein